MVVPAESKKSRGRPASKWMREYVMIKAPGRHDNSWHSAPAPQPSLPHCRQCNTDAYVEVTGYVPASYGLEGEGLLPPVVSYNCRHCGSHYAHRTREEWAPQGWQWYA